VSLDLEQQVEAGLALMAEVLGPEHADKRRQHIAGLRAAGASQEAIDQAQFAVGAAWGFMFHRKGLSLRERAITLVAADVTTQGKGALGDHVRLALYAGVTPDELRELMFTLVLYVGFPQTREANEIINPILTEFESKRGSAA
jgi:alkylhydroperoxidase/carboxymuconolactone decarboxylase family protein YurZ